MALFNDVCDNPTCKNSENRSGSSNSMRRTSDCDLNANVDHDEKPKEMNSLVSHDLLELAGFLSFRDRVHVFATLEQASWEKPGLGTKIKAGDSNEAVRDFLAARYGQFVLLKPPFDGRTLLLWSSPLLALAAGGLAILVGRRRAHAAASVAGEALDPAEAAALSKLLTQGDNEGRPTSS